MSGILAAITAFFSVIKGVLERWFPPLTEAQTERKRLRANREGTRARALERNRAIKDLKRGKVSGIERIFNRRK